MCDCNKCPECNSQLLEKSEYLKKKISPRVYDYICMNCGAALKEMHITSPTKPELIVVGKLKDLE